MLQNVEEKKMNETKRVLEDQDVDEEFEFFISWEGGEMCAAEDVFDNGRILPFHPSQPGRRSDQSCSTASCSSRRRVSPLMHHVYALPSPKPQSGRRSSPVIMSRHRGWKDLLRLGLVQQPVVELRELRQRSVGKEMFKSGGDGGEWWLAGLSCKRSEVVEETVQPVVRSKLRRW